jgi:hypothetical protein
LYVIGGMNTINFTYVDSVEIYNPNTKTWKLMESGINVGDKVNAGIVVNMPPHFQTD